MQLVEEVLATEEVVENPVLLVVWDWLAEVTEEAESRPPVPCENAK